MQSSGVGPFNRKTLSFFFDCAHIIRALEIFVNKNADLFGNILCWIVVDEGEGNHCRIDFMVIDITY